MALSFSSFPPAEAESPSLKRLRMDWSQLPTPHKRRFSANDVELHLRAEIAESVEVLLLDFHQHGVRLLIELPQELVISDPQIAKKILGEFLRFSGQLGETQGTLGRYWQTLRRRFTDLFSS